MATRNLTPPNSTAVSKLAVYHQSAAGMMSTRTWLPLRGHSICTDARCHTSCRYNNLLQNVAEKHLPSRVHISTNDMFEELADDADWWKRG
jgi:hypothetical protein